MAMTALGGRYPMGGLPNSFSGAAGAPVLTAITINAAGEKVGFVFQAPKAGTLHSFEWRTATVSNDPDNGVRMSFQSINATTGVPDDGVDQFFVHDPNPLVGSTWQVPSGPLTDDGTGGGVKRTVTQGEWLAAVIDNSSFTALDSFQVATLTGSANTPLNSSFYTADGSTGTYAKSPADIPIFALKYDDSTYAQFDFNVFPIVAVNNNSFGSGSTPDERALRFQVPVAMRCVGVKVRADINDDVDFILYDNASSVLASVSVDGNINTNTYVAGEFLFTASVDLTAATTYRLAMKPTTATTSNLPDFTVNANAILEGVPGGIQVYGSTRTDAGAWTDSTTTRPLIVPLFDAVDTTAGGGGGAHSAVFFG